MSFYPDFVKVYPHFIPLFPNFVQISIKGHGRASRNEAFDEIEGFETIGLFKVNLEFRISGVTWKMKYLGIENLGFENPGLKTLILGC